MTLDEAIKVLRQHNVTGASVLRITRGQALEKDLLSQVLDSCEQLISEKAEYKRLLKAAVEDIRHCMHYYDPCEVCSLLDKDGECPATDDDDCKEKYKWRYEDEALKLIGEVGDPGD